MANPSDRASRQTRLHRRMRIGLFIALAVGLAAAIGFATLGAERDPKVHSAEIERVIAQAEAGAEPSDSDRALLDALAPMRVPFERIAFDLRSRALGGVSRLDAAYSDQLSEQISSQCREEPERALALLRAYLAHGRTAEKRLLALVVLREMFAKKYSIFHAERMLLDPDPTLAGLARSILAGTYAVRGLRDKLAEPDLAGPVRPTAPVASEH